MPFKYLMDVFSNIITVTIIITINTCLSSTLLFEKSRAVFFGKLESLRKQANSNFVQGATDYGQFKIDYILKHRTREEGL